MRFAVALLLFLLSAGWASAERRVALVMGADDYKTVRPLENAVSDARTLERALEKLGFEVFVETDRDLRRMRRALEDFRADAAGADVALVFFAGHGVEIAGENRLLPVDVDASSLEALKSSTLPLEEITDTVRSVAPVALVLLDACRNDPFGEAAAGGRGASQMNADAKPGTVKAGLGRVGKAENVLFAFAAAPGKTALDGAGANSPFTLALAEHLGTEGVQVGSALKLVQQDVYDKTRGEQLPFIEDGLPQLFFASAQGDLPERERLLLAMADLSVEMRGQVERIASARDMPLAPLYAALIGSDLHGLSFDERSRQLEEAADAFVAQRNELKKLSSFDPEVGRLRAAADKQLALGAYETARKLGEQAAALDRASADLLDERAVERRLSEAATYHFNGGMAMTALRADDALADYQRAAAIYAKFPPDMASVDKERQVQTLERLANLQLRSGNLALSIATFETWLDLLRRRAESDPANAEWQQALSYGYERVAGFRSVRGDDAGALAYYQSALDVAERLAAADKTDLRWQAELAKRHARLADILLRVAREQEARRSYAVAFEIRQRLAAFDPGNNEWQDALASSYRDLAELRQRSGDTSGALEAQQASVDIMERVAARDSANPQWQDRLAIYHRTLADMRMELKDFEGALAGYQKVHAIREALAAIDPENIYLQRDLALSYSSLAQAQSELGDLRAARRSLQANLDILIRLVEVDPTDVYRQRDLSAGYTGVGILLINEGDFDAALAAHRKSLEIRLRLAATDPGSAEWMSLLIISHEFIGDTLKAKGDLKGALEAYRAGIEVRLRRDDKDGAHPYNVAEIARQYVQVADLCDAVGDRQAAVESYRASLEIYVRLGDREPERAEWQRNRSLVLEAVGDLQRGQGDLAAALASYEESRALRERLAARFPDDAAWQRELSRSFERIGDAQAERKDLPAALESHRHALAIRQRLIDRDPENTEWQRGLSVSLIKLAEIQETLGEWPTAQESYRQALTLVEKLAVRDPAQPDWQRDLIMLHLHIAKAGGDAKLLVAKALDIALELEAKGILAPGNARLPDILRKAMAKLEAD